MYQFSHMFQSHNNILRLIHSFQKPKILGIQRFTICPLLKNGYLVIQISFLFDSRNTSEKKLEDNCYSNPVTHL